jgi:hypothetical protein
MVQQRFEGRGAQGMLCALVHTRSLQPQLTQALQSAWVEESHTQLRI